MKTVLVIAGWGGIGQEVVRKLSEEPEEWKVVAPKWRYPEALPEEMSFEPDFVINCAGYIEPAPVNDSCLDSFRQEMETNYFLPLFLMQLYPDAVHVHLGSSAGDNPRGGWAGYCASKAALHSLVASAAQDGVAVYGVAPGRTRTPMRYRVAGEEPDHTLLEPSSVAEVIYHIMSRHEVMLPGVVLAMSAQRDR